MRFANEFAKLTKLVDCFYIYTVLDENILKRAWTLGTCIKQ